MGLTTHYVFTCDATQYDGAHSLDVASVPGGVWPAGWVAVTVPDRPDKTFRFHAKAEAAAFTAGTAGAGLAQPLPVTLEYGWHCDYEAGHMADTGEFDTITLTPDLPAGWVRAIMPTGETKVFHSVAHAESAIQEA